MTVHHWSDIELARRMLKGDEEAFEVFFEDNFPRLYRFAILRVDSDPDAAEDVVQDTLCKAIDKMKTYRGEAPLFTWLCTFCRHEISAHWRRQKRAARTPFLAEDDAEVRAALASLAAAEDTPEESAHRNELARLVQVTLDHLPARYGNALEWKYIEGLSVKEIAERFRIGPKAAESLLTRARQAFRDGFATLNGSASQA